MSDPHFLALGGGVQSSTLALLAAKGKLTPMPEAAIFADTGAEAEYTYAWIEKLRSLVPFPILWERAPGLSLAEAALTVVTSKHGRNYRKASVPAHAFNDKTQRGALLERRCTAPFKIEVIRRAIRQRVPRGSAIVWIGISCDEADRVKPSQVRWLAAVWPLLDLGFTRASCENWLVENGYQIPARSSCIFCPYKSDKNWAFLKENSPKDFARAVEFEKELQRTSENIPSKVGKPFLHRGLIPLEQTEFKHAEGGFSNECSGVCGV